MKRFKILFFGSFQSYSVQVLDALLHNFSVIGVVTTPPKPKGRQMKLSMTEVQKYAEKHTIPVFPLISLSVIPKNLEKPDFIVVAGYGKLIPSFWLEFPKFMPVNMHPSLLPSYRGPFPIEWALIRGEKETGVTLVKMSMEFDKGETIASQAIPIQSTDTKELLYHKLYQLGANMLVMYLPKIARKECSLTPQSQGTYFYARKITREDGFVSWETIQKAMHDASGTAIERNYRALTPWPGIWTEVEVTRDKRQEKKRLKILSCRLSPASCLILDTVQLEGKKPVPFTQFRAAYDPAT
jgi:methionyl-tRNA formyltransferase